MLSALSQTGTIVALASAPGRSGVAVVRLSGPESGAAFCALSRRSSLPEPRVATLVSLFDPQKGERLDHSLVLWFPAPASFTGEDVLELHLHGGRAVVSSVLAALCALPGIRPAEAGAFTRRAFENGKMDLTEAEALADLVDAETSAQRRQALRQMDGALGQLYQGWADRLTHRLAFIEAEIDFSDEELPPEITAERLDDLYRLESEMTAHLEDGRRGERLREGFSVAILGPPNAGKSSLLNALAQREAAIVSSIPGTTRDAIDVQLDIGGYPVELVDTAGLRESADFIENEGIRRALKRAEQADLTLLLFDGAAWPFCDERTLALQDARSLRVLNKADQLSSIQQAEAQAKGFMVVSVQSGQGMSELLSLLVAEIDLRYMPSGAPALTRARHRLLVEDARDQLRSALHAPEVELCAESLRLALRSLGRITGHVDVEDLLDIVFSSFCIGK